MQTHVSIITDRHMDGSYSYQFTLDGRIYEDRDFTTRERALEEARSVARVVVLNPNAIL